MVTAPDIPGHRVASVLGAGGFATVYRCWQIAVGREVAVKVDNRVLLTERDRRRFLREVTAAGRLSGHPHVIDVYDAGTLGDGRPFMVMELCPAGSLSDALRRHGPRPAGQVRDIGVRLADALAAAHASGILHRDIKPANILVNRFGMVGLSDFGLASIISAHGDQTASREALTPAYSSPETFRGEEPSVLADVYSLAATLYALLSGLPPHFTPGEKAPGFATLMRLHDEPVQDVPGAPPDLMALLRAALSPDPAMRPPSATALRDALGGLGGRGPAAPAGYGPPPLAAGDREPAPGPGRPPSARAAAHRTGPFPSDGGPTTSGRHRPADGGRTRPGRSARRAGLAAGLVVIVAVATVLGARFFGHGASPGAGSGASQGAASTETSATASAAASTASVYGIATRSTGCPAAAVRGAVARCPAEPECFNGLVFIAGSGTASPLPCDTPHYYETFAIAILPAGVQTFDQPVVAADPTVRRVCSQAVMLASRQGRARLLPGPDWEIQVLPPSESAFDSGARAYRCVANEIGHQPSVPQFGGLWWLMEQHQARRGELAAVFGYPGVAGAYRHRPPYPAEVFDILERIITDRPRRVLDIGAGEGALARPLARRVDQVDAVEPSAAMTETGRRRPGGDHPALRWIAGTAETAPLGGPYALVTAGASLHWMSWRPVLTRLGPVMTVHAYLAVVDHGYRDLPWQAELAEIIVRHSRSPGYDPAFSLTGTLQAQGLLEIAGRAATAPVRFRQPVAGYVEHFHSTSSLARELMTGEEAAAFDRAVAGLVRPYAVDGLLDLPVVADLAWGRVTVTGAC